MLMTTNYILDKKENKYLLKIPQKVESKIRTWCTMLPNNEWSGVLFYSINGHFDDDTLEVKIFM